MVPDLALSLEPEGGENYLGVFGDFILGAHTMGLPGDSWGCQLPELADSRARAAAALANRHTLTPDEESVASDGGRSLGASRHAEVSFDTL